MNFKDKKVLVCGMALSGIYSATLLNFVGAKVILQDIKNDHEAVLKSKELIKKGIKVYLGKNPDDIIENIDIMVLSPGISLNLPFVHKAREKGVYIIGELELASIFFKGKMLAITGTNGKTTTTTLLGEIIKNHTENMVVVGNIGIPFTKEVLSLDNESIAVVEVSSFQLETIDKFKPLVSAVLNITKDHLDRHVTFENYISIKERIYKNQNKDDYLILNYDNIYCNNMANKTNAKVIFFSSKKELKEGIFLKDDNIYVKILNKNFKLIHKNEIKIIGNHNIENVMASVAMALCIDIPIDIIRKTIKQFKPVQHRMEYVDTINNISFYNDSKATNPDSAIKSIEAINSPIVLIAGGYNKDSDLQSFVKSFKQKVKYLVLLGKSSDEILEICNKINFNNVKKVSTMQEAVNFAYTKASSKDCVLLSPACASFDMFKSYEERGNIFKDSVFGLRGE